MSSIQKPALPSSSPNGSSKRASKKLLNLLTLFGSLLILLILLAVSKDPKGADSPQCRSIYMYPSYARVTGFDTSHTRLALKYNLFLYREQGKDKVPDENNELKTLDGIPVIFIPGNAGSYKQVRSIAAEASNIYFNNKDNKDYKGKNFDFFSAHFNEDFTAFHGRTMLDQAEYINEAVRFILSLYSGQSNPPSSVIVIGHSMGGVVARVMLTLPNYLEGSINTIITLAAPHAAAPATFDGDLMQTYAAADRLWRAGYYDKEQVIPQERLKDVSLISITGGLSDTVLPADYTTLAGLVPESNGFTVYTSGIPGIWTPIDHLAIVWCDQLRKVLVSTLFDVVDPLVPTRTKILGERMSVFRKHLLSGFESDALQDFSASNYQTTLRLRLQKEQIQIEPKSLIFHNPSNKFHLIPLFNTEDPSFTFLSTIKPASFNTESEGSFLLLCKEYTEFSGRKSLIDVGSDDAAERADFECIDISSDIYPVPNSLTDSLKDSSVGGELTPFSATKLPSSLLTNYTYVIFREAQQVPEDYFTSISLNTTSNFEINASVLDLFIGTSFIIPSNELSKDVKITNAWSSLLSYKVQAFVEDDHSTFKPFIRQWIQDPFETKWHLGLDHSKSISFHGISPYTPFKLTSNPVHLELWSQQSSKDVKFTIKIDIFESLKLLVLRYRLAAASFPVFIITLILLIQFNKFYDSGIFISFEDGLNILTSKTWLISALLSVLTPLTSGPLFHWAFYFFDPIAKTSTTELVGTSVNPYFLGLEEKFLFILGPLFYIISLTTVHIILLVFRLVLSIVPYLVHLSQKLLNLNNQIIPRKVEEQISNVNFMNINKTRRLVGSILLLIFVMFYIPFQFAYVVCSTVQIIVAIKADLNSSKILDTKENIDFRKKNFANFNFSIMILMVWLIPVNVPVLIVFFHNVGVRWETPFSSHHNILAIFPIILLIGKNVQGEFLLQAQSKPQKRIIGSVLFYFAFFALIYGVRHLYWLHYLFNFFSALLVLLSFWK